MSLEYYRPYFNITTEDVKTRLKLSVNIMQPTFFETIKDNPDLYGPFWIYSTVVFMITAVGNLSDYLGLPSG